MDLGPESSDQPVALAATASRRIYYGWVIVIVCLVVMTLAAPLLASFSVFYVALLNELKWSRGETALAVSIFLVMNGLTGPVAGGLIDRFGPRWVMPVGTVITAGALIWLSRMTTLWEFYVAYGLLAAVGSSLLHHIPLTTIISNWFVRHRGTAIGLVTAGQGVGQILIPLIQYMIDHIGWRYAYLVIGAVVFFIPTALILLFLYNRPEARGLSLADERLPWEQGQREDHPLAVSTGSPTREGRERQVVIVDPAWANTDWTVWKAVGTSRFWTLMGLMALFATGFMIISVQLVAYLTDHGYSALMAASVVGLQGMVDIFGRILGGVLSDHLGREKTLTLSVLIFILCFAMLSLAGSSINPLLIYVFAMSYGVANGFILPPMMAAAGDIFQGKHLGSILGVLMLGGFAGGAFGSWLGGYLVDLTHTYDYNFMLAVVVMILSALLIWRVRPSQVRIIRTIPV